MPLIVVIPCVWPGTGGVKNREGEEILLPPLTPLPIQPF